jgi:hypothetical protein
MSLDREFVDTSESTGRFAFRARFLASQNLAQIMFQRFQKCVLSQWTSSAFVSAKDLQILFADHPCEEAPPVGSQFKQGTNPHQRVIRSALVGRGAAPAILSR